jgi:hypothetical protein
MSRAPAGTLGWIPAAPSLRGRGGTGSGLGQGAHG